MPTLDTKTLAQNIVDEVLRILKEQKDDKQELDLHGSINVPTHVFNYNLPISSSQNTSNAIQRDRDLRRAGHFIAGPIRFKNPFSSPPEITFGQQTELSTIAVEATATAHIPFLVEPYVVRFAYTNGQVDGFYLGLYALTDPPSGTRQHTINWRAIGSGSGYNKTTADSWSEAYDHNAAEYLVDHN